MSLPNKRAITVQQLLSIGNRPSGSLLTLALKGSCGSQRMRTFTDSLNACNTREERRQELHKSGLFFCYIDKSVTEGQYSKILPDGFCFYGVEASAYYGRPLLLNIQEDRELFKKFYTDVLPKRLGQNKLNVQRLSDNNISYGNKLSTVLEYLENYPSVPNPREFPLPRDYWGGSNEILSYSYTLGEPTAAEPKDPHIA